MSLSSVITLKEIKSKAAQSNAIKPPITSSVVKTSTYLETNACVETRGSAGTAASIGTGDRIEISARVKITTAVHVGFKAVACIGLALAMPLCASKEDFMDAAPLTRDPFQWPEKKIMKVTANQAPKKENPVTCNWQVRGVSLSTRPCALLSKEGKTVVAYATTDLGTGWKLEHVSATSVVLRHTSGTHKELTV